MDAAAFGIPACPLSVLLDQTEAARGAGAPPLRRELPYAAWCQLAAAAGPHGPTGHLWGWVWWGAGWGGGALQPATPAAAQAARPRAWALATHVGGASQWQHVPLPPAAPFATAAQFRAIPRAGRAASVARPRDAPASRPGGRAPLPFRRGKAHPGDREGHARLVALTDHAVDGRSSRTTTRWRTRTSRSCRPAAARGGHGQRRVLQNGRGRLP